MTHSLGFKTLDCIGCITDIMLEGLKCVTQFANSGHLDENVGFRHVLCPCFELEQS